MTNPEAPADRLTAAVFAGLDAIRQGVAVWDATGRLQFFNQPFAEMYHAIAARLVPGLAYGDFLVALAQSGELVLEDHGGGGSAPRWIEQEAGAFGSDRTSEQNHADGRTFELSQSSYGDGAVVQVVNDITIAKRGERALRKARDIAEAADQSKSRFLRAANHDLRQPLATLKILIYNCMTEEDEAHRKDLLHAMDISVAIMEDLLGALLQIGQLDAGKIVPRQKTFQISQILERLAIQFGHQAREKGVGFEVVHSSASIVSDKALLERILSNFVANAIRYTEVGRILVGCRRIGSRLRIEVWDTGRGIAEEHIGRIFDEFYQVTGSKHAKHRGLGLGLNIVKRLSALLEHKITVRSQPGRGSLFAIEVPAGNVWQSDVGEPEISEMIGGEFAGLPILIVEDDEVLRQATKDLLERWGITVHAATDEEEAHEFLRNSGLRPRLVIADYSLRGQHGTDVVNSIRAFLGEKLPSIIVTADTDPALIGRIKSEGFPVLIKPVSPPRLRVLMHNLLYEPSLETQAESGEELPR
jgi:signal transduction histidine kinase/CheY-like chemotaxis protein